MHAWRPLPPWSSSCHSHSAACRNAGMHACSIAWAGQRVWGVCLSRELSCPPPPPPRLPPPAAPALPVLHLASPATCISGCWPAAACLARQLPAACKPWRCRPRQRLSVWLRTRHRTSPAQAWQQLHACGGAAHLAWQAPLPHHATIMPHACMCTRGSAYCTLCRTGSASSLKCMCGMLRRCLGGDGAPNGAVAWQQCGA